VKKFDKLLVRSFIGPFFITFFITLFIFVMQFLWKYIDDLVGKGLEWTIILKLLFFASASFVPMVIPLAVLLSSIMTLGKFAEQYELVAVKTSGISLLQFMRGLIGTVLLISIGTFLFANHVLPVANLKFGSLLYDIRKQKPALNIKEGIFYKGIEGYSIWVGDKGPDNQTIYDILVYDHTGDQGNNHVLIADRGKMYTSKDERYLILRLFKGRQYREMVKKGSKQEEYEHVTTVFEKWEKFFDLSEFNLSRTKEGLFKDHYEMLNLGQLEAALDTLAVEKEQKKEELEKNLTSFFHFYKVDMDSVIQANDVRQATQPAWNADSGAFIKRFAPGSRRGLMKRALSFARNTKSYIKVAARDMRHNNRLTVRHKNEWHRKFTLSVACLVLFFIGAPMGAIIRKGGIGMPLLMAIIFFVVYHVFTMSGEKMAEEQALSPFVGMWLATLVLLPISIFLTYKATLDSQLFNLEWYYDVVRRLFGRKSNDDQQENPQQ